jgi:hypothetical protein
MKNRPIVKPWMALAGLVTSVLLAYLTVCFAIGSFLPTPGVVVALNAAHGNLGAFVAMAVSIDSLLYFGLLWAGYALFRWLKLQGDRRTDS